MPSSVIRSFSYDRANAALDVTFVSGRRYRYFLVPAYVAEGFTEAFSKGRYFNARVRDRFPCEELEPAEDEAPARITSPRRGSRRRP
jgi:lysyl-tRNA synthetase class 2